MREPSKIVKMRVNPTNFSVLKMWKSRSLRCRDSELSSPAPLVSAPVESCTPEELLPETDDWFYNEGSPQPRPRPEPGFYKASHVFMTTVDRLERLSHDFDVYNAKLDRAIRIFNDASKK